MQQLVHERGAPCTAVDAYGRYRDRKQEEDNLKMKMKTKNRPKQKQLLKQIVEE